MWFDSWADLTRLLVVAPVAYVLLLLVLRVTGKRALSKLNAFDLRRCRRAGDRRVTQHPRGAAAVPAVTLRSVR